MLWSEPNPIPKCDSNPNVGLCPTMPEKAAGIRIEPPWSPPKEMSTSRGRHSRGGARGRSAGHVIVIVGVEGPAVVADGAAGAEAATQSVHDVLADDGAPLLQHPGDDGCVEVGDEAFEGEGAEAHRYTCHSDVLLVTDSLAGKQAFSRPLDAALPHPGVEGVFIWARPVPGLAGGRDHRRLMLLQPGLHERVELSHLFHQVLPVHGGLIGTEADPQFLGHGHHCIDVRYFVHEAPFL